MRLIECTSPSEIEAAQRLRYEVFCLEKGWIDPADFPDGLEKDEYDDDAVHFLITDDTGEELLGASRLLLGSRVVLPAARFIDFAELGLQPEQVVEVSRLASRQARRSQSLSVFLAMTQAMWEWSMEHDMRAWVSIADVPVFLLMKRIGMPIIAASERVEYLGSVCVPSCVDMEHTGDVLARRGFDARSEHAASA